MVESLLRSFGLRTGLFTSPHLSDARERICFDGEPISAERLLATWEEIAPYVGVVDANSAADGGVPLSYFEVMTALAFAAFADAPVDVAIVEVGLGGGWDSTNVADGVVAVIAPIGLDHSDYLGDSIAGIAREKAGIIKPGAIAVVAEQELVACRGHPRARCRGGRCRGARGPGVRDRRARPGRRGPGAQPQGPERAVRRGVPPALR